MRILFIINGSKKLSKIANEAIQLIKNRDGNRCEIIQTQFRKEATEIARKESLTANVIIAVGGDGTCNEIVEGIAQSGNKDVLFGVIPNGTGNDFLRMTIGFDSNRFVDRVSKAEYLHIDLGYVKTKEGDRHFLNIADIGLGGKVVEIMNRQRKVNIGGKFSYASAILRGFLSYKKSEMTIVGDDFTHTGKVLMLAACNGAVFGHGLVVGPEAKLDDGIINITLLGNITVADYLKNLKKIKRGDKIKHPEVFYFKSKHIKISQTEGQMYSETDGELVYEDILEIGLRHKDLKMVNKLKPNLMY